MKPPGLATMTVDQLVGKFVEIAIAQDDAMLANDKAEFTPLYWHGCRQRGVEGAQWRPANGIIAFV